VDGSGRRWKRVLPDSRVNAKWFGGVANGAADDTDAVMAAAAFVRAGVWTNPTGGDRLSKLELHLPAGVWLITTSEALLPSTFQTKSQGYRITGAGRGQTVVWFKPTGGSRILFNNNNAYMASEVEDIAFISDNASNVFMRSYSYNPPGAVQAWTFNRCRWDGLWGKGFDLSGNNNNSEWRFDDCGVSGYMGKFLYQGPTGTSDQSLNFWFHNFKFWATDATQPGGNTWVDLATGGHVKIVNCDVSGYQNGCLFNLYGAAHAYGVCFLQVHNTRFEMKSTNTKLIQCEWSQGAVTFDKIDLSSQASVYAKETIIAEFKDSNFGGPIVTFRDSELIGTVKFSHSTDDWRHRKITQFEACRHVQFSDITEAFLFEASANDAGHRSVVLRHSAGVSGAPLGTYTAWAPSTSYTAGAERRVIWGLYICTQAGVSASSGPGPMGKGSGITDGTCVWRWVRNDTRDYASDCTLNWHKRANPNSVQRHVVSFKQPAGNFPTAGGTQEIILPPNAIVVGARLHSPNLAGGGVSSAAAADYKLQTCEAVPTVLLSNNTTPASAGFDALNSELWFPVGSDMNKRCIRLVSGSSVDQGNSAAMAVIEYMG